MRLRLTVALAAAAVAAGVMLVSGFGSGGPAPPAAPAHHLAAATALPAKLAAPDRAYRAALARLARCTGVAAQIRQAARLRAAALRGASAAGPASLRTRAASLRRARILLTRARLRCTPTPTRPPTAPAPVAPAPGTPSPPSTAAPPPTQTTPPPPSVTTPPPTPPPPQSSQVIDVTADANSALRFVQTSLTASAGAMTIHFTNPSAVTHNVGISGAVNVGPSSTVRDGGVVNLEANLPPGTYTVYCGVGNHAQLGMAIPLIVNP